MFERYTERAHCTIFFARYEASALGSQVIESEHLLLGTLREHKALTENLLPSGAAEEVRIEIERRNTRRTRISTSVDLPLSRECHQALLSGVEEARRLEHKHIGNEHLLVGLLLEEKSFAAELLRSHGVNLDVARMHLNDPTGG